MAARALILDLDGTVWDSYPWLARLAGGGGRKAEAAALAVLRDSGNAAKLLRDAGITSSRFKSICATSDELRTYAGVRSTLRALREGRVPLGVVTNLPGWIAEPMLSCTGIAGYFGSVVVWSRAQKSSRILASLAELGVEPAPNVWYVGDLATDGAAAARAGVSFAWASYGYGAARPSGTSAVIKAFRDVAAL